MAHAGMRGRGPGDIAPDGSAVEFYARMPPDERAAALVHAALPPEATILEIGAGAGRVTRPLLGRGHPVLAVDESAEMLARIDGARTACGRIQDLDLGERFDCVLMMSYLVNYGDRRALLDACARHTVPGGLVIFERETPAWHATVGPGGWSHDGVDFRMFDVERPEPGVLTATIESRVGDESWTHAFTSRVLRDEELPEVLETSGLRFERFLDEDGAWVAARNACR